MRKKLVFGGAAGIAVAVGVVVAVATLPASAGPKPTEVVHISKVTGNYREVRKQVQEGHLVGAPSAASSVSLQPTPGPTQ